MQDEIRLEVRVALIVVSLLSHDGFRKKYVYHTISKSKLKELCDLLFISLFLYFRVYNTCSTEFCINVYSVKLVA